MNISPLPWEYRNYPMYDEGGKQIDEGGQVVDSQGDAVCQLWGCPYELDFSNAAANGPLLAAAADLTKALRSLAREMKNTIARLQPIAGDSSLGGPYVVAFYTESRHCATLDEATAWIDEKFDKHFPDVAAALARVGDAVIV